MNAPLTPEQLRQMQTVRLDDKYELQSGMAWMSGIHALVRLPMNQRTRDQRSGWNTAGFISGYRGSPLGGLDTNLMRAAKHLKSHHVVFQPGVNEDLAATAVWGSQQVNLFPGAKYDGVFGMWYGKGPGVDRSGDVFKHANAAGTSARGGVLLVAGDDHPAKSSTLPHQSDHILKACGIPVLFPAGVQEILDFGIHGWAMSRYAGLWVGMKCITDIVEVSASVEVDPERVIVTLPDDFILPPEGLNIRVPDTPLQQEARLLDYKLYAAIAYCRANKLNRELWQVPDDRARLGIVTSGKAHLDTMQALFDLGLTPEICQRIGVRLFKVGMVWPLESTGLQTFAQNLDEILVVEEKRQVVEYQVKEELFGLIGSGRKIPRVVGKFDDKDGGEWAVPQGNWLLPAHFEFSPAIVAKALGARLLKLSLPDDVRAGIQARLDFIQARERELSRPRVTVERKPWFCSGCPHNTSTRVPEGSRGMAGIGCHYMVTWMGRNTQVYTQMGGEGVPWIGQAPFTDEKHVFANIGDGTYYHSGLLAIRAAVAANVPITYKILFNDAVAMTGGQQVDGPLNVPMIVKQLEGEGVQKIVVVTDEPEKYQSAVGMPSSVPVMHRDQLDDVQRDLRQYPSVSALIYDQTCATEKRRRRKIKQYPDPPKRVFMNDRVCEGCGDCSVKSNCLSVEPLETPLGRKRKINQSSCNKDFSCIKGFCPSFVMVEGGQLRKPKPREVTGEGLALSDPAIPAIEHSFGVLIAGVGGTGVITIGQLLGMAAHLEGKAGSVLDMAGLAQKGGAVFSHVLIAQQREEIHNTRIAMGDAELILCCDMVVGASPEAVSRMRPGTCHALLNTDIAPTAAFVSNPSWKISRDTLKNEVEQACGQGRVESFDASTYAVLLLGDAVYSNAMMMGYAYQKGWIPLHHASIEQAIALNGVDIERNQQAFDWGRRAAAHPQAFRALVMQTDEQQADVVPSSNVIELKRPASTFESVRDDRAARLVQYQNQAYAQRYLDVVNHVASEEQRRVGTDRLATAVATYLYKLMAYKDEYEVARLYSDGEFIKQLSQQFEGDWTLRFYLAPPLFSKKDKDGHLIKKAYGPATMKLFGVLASLRFLRGTWLDPFGHTAERKTERALIDQYRQDVEQLLVNLSAGNLDIAVELASLPEEIRGYGHVKESAIERAAVKRKTLLEAAAQSAGQAKTLYSA